MLGLLLRKTDVPGLIKGKSGRTPDTNPRHFRDEDMATIKQKPVVVDSAQSAHDYGIIRILRVDVEAFKRDFPTWANRQWQDDPVYCLPPDAIASLAKPISDRVHALLNSDEAAAEEAFTVLCGRHFTFGFLGSETIAFHPSTSRDFRVGELAEFFQGRRRVLSSLENIARDHATRALAYVGHLWCDPRFQADRDALRQRWFGLSTYDRPPLPLVRPLENHRALNEQYGMIFSEEGFTFVDCMVNFLNKWGLVQLSTWDVPDPQNILMVNPFPPGSPAYPAGGVNLHVPTGFPVLDRDRIHDQIQKLQDAIARKSGIGLALSGPTAIRSYAHKATVIHLERTVRQRFHGTPPKGFASHVIRAAATILKRSEETVDRYRKEINRSLRKAVPTGNG
jgi:hypothetical protein